MDNPKELAEQLRAAQDALAAAKAIVTEHQKAFDHLRFNVIPDALNELGVSSLQIPGVGRLGLTEDMRTTVLAENRDEAYEWLATNGFGDIVVETVHSSTMKAWMKEQIGKDVELPDIFQWTPFQRASLTKK
jgi:hypothetical protein